MSALSLLRRCGLFCCLLLPVLTVAEPPAKTKIAMLTLKDQGFRNDFWDAMQMGARKAAQEYGVELIYLGIDTAYAKDRVKGQSARFREVAAQGAQAIVFTPCDRLRMVPAVEEAVVADIKVIAIDSPIETDLISGQIGTNNYQGGLLAAQRMAESMQGKGNVLVLCHPLRQNLATRDREIAFIAGLHQYAPAIQVLSQDSCGTATLAGDSAASARLFLRWPQAQGFYCVSGTCLPGALRAQNALPRKQSRILIGWDPSPDALQGLRNHRVDALLIQDPERMGYLGVQAAVQALQGKENRFRQDTGVTLVTAENIGQPAIQRRIKPDIKGWIP